MSYAELIEKLQILPPEKQVEVFDFVEFLTARCAAEPSEVAQTRRARGAMKGMLSSVDEFMADNKEEKALEER